MRSRKGARLSARPSNARYHRASGFTLLELLVAMTILVIAMAVIWQTFSSTIGAWRRGGELLDELRHGDFVMEQLVSALRSAAFFESAPGKYGFTLKNSDKNYPADKLSWVTASSAFMQPDSPLMNSLHRIVFSIEDGPDGDLAVAIRAYPQLADMEEDDVDPWFVSSEVKGINCRVYDLEADSPDWENDWEDTNSIPSLMEITLYMDPLEKYGDPITIQRIVEIPVARKVDRQVEQDTGDGGTDSGRSETDSGRTADQTQKPSVSVGTGNRQGLPE